MIPQNFRALAPYFLIVILLIIMGYRECSRPKDRQYFEKPGFKPDTTRKKVYEPPKQKGDSMPPKEVIVYVDRPIPVEKPKSYTLNDSEVILEYPKGNINYHKNFLEYSPGSPKLLFAKFTGQGFHLDLLDTNGKVFSSIYETQYQDYDYFYKDKKITYSAKKRGTIPEVKKPKVIHTTLGTGVLYEVFTKSPTLQVDGSIGIKAISLYGQSQLLYSPTAANLQGKLFVGVRYSFK